MQTTQSPYSPVEEWANSLTHGVGALLSLTALILMVIVSAEQGDPWRIVASSIYGGSMVLLFTASTCYHAIPWQRSKAIFKQLDHCAIYLLIAGSYTPFLLISLRGPLGWTLFGIVWGLALAGLVLKLGWGHRFKALRVASYLVMGWLILFASPSLPDAIGSGGIAWLVAGGACYSIGVIFYLQKQRKFAHSIWHLFVLGGGACHFFAVWRHVLPAELQA